MIREMKINVYAFIVLTIAYFFIWFLSSTLKHHGDLFLTNMII